MSAIISVILHGDGSVNDLAGHPDNIIHLTGSFTIIRLSHGMESGATSLMIRIDLPDGRSVLQETSLKVFLAAARTLEAAEHIN